MSIVNFLKTAPTIRKAKKKDKSFTKTAEVKQVPKANLTHGCPVVSIFSICLFFFLLA